MSTSSVAKQTADLLVGRLSDRLIDSIWASYEEACNGPLAQFGAKPREASDEDRERLRFEIVAFATYILMGQEVPKLFRRRRLLRWVPDVEAIQSFNETLAQELVALFDSLGATRLHEIVMAQVEPTVKLGFGQERLDFGRRVAQYVSVGSAEQLVTVFGTHIARGLDWEHAGVLSLVAGSYAKLATQLAGVALASAAETEA